MTSAVQAPVLALVLALAWRALALVQVVQEQEPALALSRPRLPLLRLPPRLCPRSVRLR